MRPRLCDRAPGIGGRRRGAGESDDIVGVGLILIVECYLVSECTLCGWQSKSQLELGGIRLG